MAILNKSNMCLQKFYMYHKTIRLILHSGKPEETVWLLQHMVKRSTNKDAHVSLKRNVPMIS